MAPYLPLELWILICELLDVSSLKSFRISSRKFHHLTSPILFQTVYFNLDPGGVDKLVAISEQEALRGFVRSLVLRRDRGLYEFSDGFESWESSIVHESGQSNSSNDNGPCGEDKPSTKTTTSECGLMSPEEWRSMGKNARRQLYEEYERDRIDLQENMLNLAHTIRFKPLGLLAAEGLANHRVAGADPGPSQSDRLDHVISRLPNLKRLLHEPAYLTDDDWGVHWRRLSFDREKLLYNTTDKEEERAESLQVSLVLRALGLRRRLNKSLVTLELHVAGPSFWGATALGRLWNPERTRRMRGNGPMLTIEDVDLDMEIDQLLEPQARNSSALSHQEHLTRELITMEDAFVNLTEIDLDINCCQYDADPSAVVLQLYYFLRQSEGLTKLSLMFKSQAFHRGEPNYSYPEYEEQHSQAMSRLLHWFALGKFWPLIQELRLSINVGAEDLIRFLLGTSPTLHCLTLESVALSPGPKGWEDVFESLSRSLRLESFKFRCLEDNSIPGGRVIGEPTKPEWSCLENELSCYCHYEDAICSYVLGKSTEKPLVDPLQFLQHHIQVCERARMATPNIQALS